MGPSREPPGPNRERRPCQGASLEKSLSVGGASLSGRAAGQQILFNRIDTELDRLRAENARRARLEAELRRVYRGGARVTVELFLLFAELLGAEGLLLELAPRFGGFDQSFLRDRIGHEFPLPPVHVVAGRDR